MEKRYPRVMLSTACIPWNENNEFIESMFRKEVRRIINAGVKHVYVMGTAGEGYAITRDEFKSIVSVFKEEMDGPGLHPMVCVISLSTQEIMERIQIAYEMGIREFQIVLPSWGTLNDREVIKYFHTVCDSFKDCLFLHYNLGRSGRVLGIEHYMNLAQEIPNLVAAKFTAPNTVIIQEILNCNCPIQFFVGDLGWAYGSQIGECGYLMSVAGGDLQVAREYFEAGINKDTNKLFKLEKDIGLIRKKLVDTVGTNAMDGAYDKMSTKLALPDFPLRLRPPYEYPSDEDFIRYRDYIRNNFPYWKV